MWKDFVAPEHPVGLLSFLRRINEAYSPDLGPLLVHCSAGVGRTGTLVALDTLVAELDDENQASIFNIICDLRHQRNFLVQSLVSQIFHYFIDFLYKINLEMSKKYIFAIVIC
ncbi:Tyrosine-protein phosphatase 99A, partial [Armadillidium nasatum]